MSLLHSIERSYAFKKLQLQFLHRWPSSFVTDSAAVGRSLTGAAACMRGAARRQVRGSRKTGFDARSGWRMEDEDRRRQGDDGFYEYNI